MLHLRQPHYQGYVFALSSDPLLEASKIHRQINACIRGNVMFGQSFRFS
jgi:hypothetical protein